MSEVRERRRGRDREELHNAYHKRERDERTEVKLGAREGPDHPCFKIFFLFFFF